MENQRDHFALRKQDNEFLRNRLNVTRDDYAKSVESLLRIAMDDTSGSKAAAQVLLSVYNGNRYPMNLMDLSLLDLKYLESAVIVMLGRALLSEEPHNVIENGRERFFALEKAWPNLRLQSPQQ